MANIYKVTIGSLADAARTTLAATASLLLARLLKLPEFYWAPISAIVIIQSPIDPKAVAWQRFAGLPWARSWQGSWLGYFPAAT